MRHLTTRVVLRDGAVLRIRPITIADTPHIIDGFARLSSRSRRARFLSGKDQLSANELRYLTDVDHHNHEALCAFDRSDGRGVGAARYIRDTAAPDTAEMALTVVDEWQHRGVGTELLTRLTSRAREGGIRRIRAFVSSDNGAALGLVRKLANDLDVVSREVDVVQYELRLPLRSR